jgi:hypothetical protein
MPRLRKGPAQASGDLDFIGTRIWALLYKEAHNEADAMANNSIGVMVDTTI